MFAVIELYLNYDHVDSLKCLKIFEDKNTANEYVDNITVIRKELYKTRDEYINNFVNKIEIPDTRKGVNFDGETYAYTRWQNFLKTYNLNTNHINEKNFHKELKEYLKDGHHFSGFSTEPYNPPPKPSYSDLYVIPLP